MSTRNTTVLVLFTSLTNLADGVTKVALPLLATRFTRSPVLVSAVALTLTLPWLLAALHVGVLVDRYDRRRLLWIANTVRLAAVAALLGTTVTGTTTLSALYLGGIALGVAEVVALTSATALVPMAIAPGKLERANAWVAGAETVCNEFCGPFVGGLLVAAGASVALGATGAAYVTGMAVLLLLAGRFAPRAAGDRPAGSVNQRIAEGLHLLWHQRLLRMTALALTVLCACWGGWFALMPLMATGPMGLSAQQYGMLLSSLGAGGLVGALTVGPLNRLLGRRRVMFADLLGTAAMMAAPVLTTNLWPVAASAFVGGMGGVLWTVNSRTIGQRMVATELMGRYNAAARLFSWGAMPLGAGLAGVLAQWFGLRAAFAVFAGAALLVVVPFLRAVTPRALAEATAYRDPKTRPVTGRSAGRGPGGAGRRARSRR
nr:MFS transporter [Streptomyces carminius]